MNVKGKLLTFRQRFTSGEMSDAALLAACELGEAPALAALFDRYSRDVFRILGRIRGTDAVDLEDLLQATFIEVQRSAHGYRGEAPVKAWILSIAANVARHHVRNEMRRKANIEASTHVPQRQPELPSEQAERDQLIRRMGPAIAALDENRRMAFVLCDLEEMQGVEAARVLGVRPGTLWRRLHEARQILRRVLEGENKC